MKGKYVIRAVDPAGTPWDVCVTDYRDSAREIVAALMETEKGRSARRFYWPEHPEKGEIDLYE